MHKSGKDSLGHLWRYHFTMVDGEGRTYTVTGASHFGRVGSCKESSAGVSTYVIRIELAEVPLPTKVLWLQRWRAWHLRHAHNQAIRSLTVYNSWRAHEEGGRTHYVLQVSNPAELQFGLCLAAMLLGQGVFRSGFVTNPNY